MNSTPSLSSHNCFNVLYIEQINDIETKTQDMQKPDPCCIESWMEAFPSVTFSSNTSWMEALPSVTSSVQTHCTKWEKSFPQKFVIAATEENPTSLKLKVKIKTTDMAEKKSISALVDCGATGEFIDRQVVFKGPVARTKKMTETGPNITDCNQTSSCGCSVLGSVQLPVSSYISMWKNHRKLV